MRVEMDRNERKDAALDGFVSKIFFILNLYSAFHLCFVRMEHLGLVGVGL
jgi:hypothetical protein